MNKIDALAIKAKNSEIHLEKLLKRMNGRLYYSNRKIPPNIRIMYDSDGELKTFVWLLVKKYNVNIGTFINFYENSFNCLMKSEYKKYRRYNVKGKKIFLENTRLYREDFYDMETYLANKESFYLACNEIIGGLTSQAAQIFKERLFPSKKTINISIEDSFNRGGSDSPVRLKWVHLAKSVGLPYNRAVLIINNEIMPKAGEVFRNYGFFPPYEYRDGISTDWE